MGPEGLLGHAGGHLHRRHAAASSARKLQTFLQGGTAYGNLTLTRFYTLHVLLLPAALFAVLAVHLALFRKHGVTPPDAVRRGAGAPSGALLPRPALLRHRLRRRWRWRVLFVPRLAPGRAARGPGGSVLAVPRPPRVVLPAALPAAQVLRGRRRAGGHRHPPRPGHGLPGRAALPPRGPLAQRAPRPPAARGGASPWACWAWPGSARSPCSEDRTIPASPPWPRRPSRRPSRPAAWPRWAVSRLRPARACTAMIPLRLGPPRHRRAVPDVPPAPATPRPTRAARAWRAMPRARGSPASCATLAPRTSSATRRSTTWTRTPAPRSPLDALTEYLYSQGGGRT